MAPTPRQRGLLPDLLVRLRTRRTGEPAAPAPATGSFTPGLSVVMAAHQERDHLEELLADLAGFADEIVVVDAESTDGSAAVAERHAARVIPTTNKPMLEINKNIAMDAATREWILVLDPDERISPRLRAEITAVVEGRLGEPATVGWWMPRRNYILGAWLRTMGLYPAFQLRLVRNGAGRFSETSHHLPMAVDGARAGYLSGDLIHLSDHTVGEILTKRTRYAEFAAAQMFEAGTPFRFRRLLLEPIRGFTVQYLLLGGFLEGVRGLLYAGLSAYGAALRHARLWEMWRRGRR